ncbi:MAG TPA: hypothetical protein VMB05_11570 [Solirubrobacteraceae bacterium]|nr:hypothetical protein [Solirubrobacteraceae bacterium]
MAPGEEARGVRGGHHEHLTKLPPELQQGPVRRDVHRGPADRRRTRGNLAVHLRIRNQDPAQFDLPALGAAGDGFTGSEIEQCVVSARYGALHRSAPPGSQRLLEGLKATVPLSVGRRTDIEALRARTRDFVNVS